MSKETQEMATPHIKLVRLEHSHELQELLKRYHNAFILLTVIAQRARRTQRDNILNLDPGEALIGDHANYGLSEQNYRTAKKQLTKFKLATFRATTKGTVATLSSSNIYDINAEQGNDQDNTKVTDGQRTGNGRVTTKKNVRMKNEECITPPISPPGGGFFRNWGPNKEKTFKNWTAQEFREEIDKANHDDLLSPEEVEEFFNCWMEPNAAGTPRRALEKTWDTRRRMHTAVRIIFSRQREKENFRTQKAFNFSKADAARILQEDIA